MVSCAPNTPCIHAVAHKIASSGSIASPLRTRAELEAAGYYADKPKVETSVRVDIDVLTWALLGIHSMLEGATKVPEMALDENEARKIAECSARVSAFYIGEANPKIQAWGALAMVLGTVYGTRIVAYQLRMRSEREERNKARRERDALDPTKVPLTGM